MDHKEQHHEHHRKEREEKIKHQEQYERAHENSGPPIHPKWLWVGGAACVIIAMLIWTFLVW